MMNTRIIYLNILPEIHSIVFQQFKLSLKCIKVMAFVFVFIILTGFASGQYNFQPGEELKYIIYFGPINAGIADIRLDKVNYKGNQVMYSKMVARSTGLADKIYKVKDVYESYFDSISLLPYMAIRDIKEGRYRKKNIDTFDHIRNAIFSVNKGEILSPPEIRDVISSFYYIRNYNFKTLKRGDIINIELFFDDELIKFKLHYMGKERIESKMGSFNCTKFIPVMTKDKKSDDTESISPTPEDNMIIWISDDPNQIPVRVKFDLFIGSIKADLIEYKELKY